MNTKTPQISSKISLALLHEGMVDKRGDLVTTSLTMLDLHDLSRSASTFGAENFFVIHPSAALRQLAATLETHWKQGYGANYNPDRKEALGILKVLSSFEEMLDVVEVDSDEPPILVATSAKDGTDRITFDHLRKQLSNNPDRHYIILLGTGWGMGPELMQRADLILAPIYGPGEYNHLSVRSAGAIIMDRLMGQREADQQN